ncbi:NADH:flavin oxidoreductase [Teredinibacter turnerae]|uniref:NADH:flavin oxidoreductase n=1 Tax=Teredinibacter turnerae TaxID=2426 RepID=UPI00036F6160|nr:NADH:flavin oxidoreductase [Teredinibacter turnerae]
MSETTLADSVLFEPLKIGSLELKNRIVMAPMTRNMAPEGVPNEKNAAYYQRRAEGDVGLILTEGTVIDRPASRNEQHIPFVYGEAAMGGWRTVVDAVHAATGRIGPQLWHVGAMPGQSGWEPAQSPESPSGLMAPDAPRGVAMTDADIADAIAAFARSAAESKAAGFDVVEIHGAHGYLIDEFFWDKTNQRADAWGGESLVERSRFAVEVVKAVRQAVGDDFPVILRLSQWKQQDYTVKLAPTPDEMAAWLTPLADAGVDIFHCSQRRYWEPEFVDIDGEDGLNFAGWAKKLTGKATISVGSVGLNNDVMSTFSGESAGVAAIDKLLSRMDKGEFDLIAVGRALISDPHWVQKVKEGRFSDLIPFEPAQLGELN